MRKFKVLSFISLDGIIQAPGGPDEDPSGGFQWGGWTAPFGDPITGNIITQQMEPSDLLLGRKTFDIFENYWPHHAEHWPQINEVQKIVFSHTRTHSHFTNVQFIQSLQDLQNLKNNKGADIKIWGSSQLVQYLMKHDWVDEFWLLQYPVILGKGKKLFGEEALPKTYSLVESQTSPSGVIISNYRKAGAIETGTVGESSKQQ